MKRARLARQRICEPNFVLVNLTVKTYHILPPDDGPGGLLKEKPSFLPRVFLAAQRSVGSGTPGWNL